MNYSNSISEIHSFGKFVELLVESAANLYASRLRMAVSNAQDNSERQVVPTEKEIAMPKEDEIFPNRQPPQEKEYLPDREQTEIEEPKKEIQDPYFPEESDNFPPEKEQEFPQTDPL
ncbi:hypothetical protein GCM10009119_38030 [Algoriphagus jejuensis]|uniref:Uncharacterized protein n=1 Tax=Algoriphagus jejuensis TaxID=419934 RepID=A0ABN1N4L6_9BACT